MAGTADAEGLRSFEAFRKDGTGARLFRHPSPHPSGPTGFCPCDRSLMHRALFYLKAALLGLLLKLPYDGPKNWYLRRLGATVGRNVHIAAGAWIDPTFPDLLVIEDRVMVGVGAKIALHAFTPDEFIAGRVTLREGSVIGGFSLLAPGVEVGRRSVVAAGAVATKSVPDGMSAIGNPARIVRRP